MADVKLDPASVLQPGTEANYDEMARDIARTEGCSPKEGMAKLAAGFKQRAEAYPNDGWEYLADWATGRDPGDGGDPNSKAFEIYRAVESAKKEPKLALQSHPDAVEAALKALDEREEPVKADDTVPNSGPAKMSKAAAEGKKN